MDLPFFCWAQLLQPQLKEPLCLNSINSALRKTISSSTIGNRHWKPISADFHGEVLPGKSALRLTVPIENIPTNRP
jgi:hypothetical protein